MLIPFVKWTIVGAIVLVLTAAMRRSLGDAARRDPILLAGSVVSAGFLLGGVVGLVLSEPGALIALCLGIVGAIAMMKRWRTVSDAGAASSETN